MFGKVRTCVLNMPMNEGQGHPHDSSGYGNNGTNNGADWVSGDFGWSMEFNGISDYVDCGNDGSLNITNGFSIIGWINPTTFGDAHYKSNIISKEHGDTGFTLRVGLGKPTITIRSDAPAWVTAASPTAIPTDAWAYVCAVLDNTKLYIYVNGIEKAQTNFPDIPVTNALDLHIGKIPSASSRYFDGSINNVRIHNRVFSAAEILAYFNATKARYGL